MSKSYRDFPPTYASDRQRAMEERKKQSIIDKAIQESELLRRIRHERAEEKAREKVLFCLWYMLDKRLHELEEQRSMHVPASPDYLFDDDFCEAVQQIPYVKRTCNDVWFAYCNIGKPEFSNFI